MCSNSSNSLNDIIKDEAAKITKRVLLCLLENSDEGSPEFNKLVCELLRNETGEDKDGV